jgi:DNA modification methylase
MKDWKNTIHNKSLFEAAKILPDQSVDLFVLDPPYFKVVNEKWDKEWKNIDEYLEWTSRWLNEVCRVSKLNSSLWIFGFPYQLSRILPIIESCGFKFRQQIVIWKGMKSAAGRVSKKLKMFPTTTESIFFFAKDSIPDIRKLLSGKKNEFGYTSKEINDYLGKASNGGGTWSQIAGLKQKTPVQPVRDDWEKLDKLFGGLPNYDDMVYTFDLPMGLTDVWDDISFYYKKGTKIHPTQKPEQLISRIVKASSKEGQVVADFFMGSGTTAVCAKKLNRNFFGCEIDKDYYDKALDRLINIK